MMGLAIAITLLFLVQCSNCGSDGPGMAGQWAVELVRDEGISDKQLEVRAKSIAEQNGLHYKGPVNITIALFQC